MNKNKNWITLKKMQKSTKRLMACLLVSCLMACANQEKSAPVVNCELYEPVGELPPVVEDYWFDFQTIIIEKEKKKEPLFDDEILIKSLTTTVAKQREKFLRKGCKID